MAPQLRPTCSPEFPPEKLPNQCKAIILQKSFWNAILISCKVYFSDIVICILYFSHTAIYIFCASQILSYMYFSAHQSFRLQSVVITPESLLHLINVYHATRYSAEKLATAQFCTNFPICMLAKYPQASVITFFWTIKIRGTSTKIGRHTCVVLVGNNDGMIDDCIPLLVSLEMNFKW